MFSLKVSMHPCESPHRGRHEPNAAHVRSQTASHMTTLVLPDTGQQQAVVQFAMDLGPFMH